MDNYAVSDLNQAAWLVYINGLEIPAVRVDVTFGIWKPSTVDIQLIPHSLLQQIGKEDRLQVAVFYLDTHWIPEHPEFCLLGEFEINGWSYRTSPYGRVISLQGSSHLDILSQLNFFYISSLDDIVTASGIEGTNPQNKGVVKTLYPASLFLEGLTEAAQEFGIGGTSAEGELPVDKFIKRPIDFVFNLFRSILLEVDTSSEDPTVATAGSGKLPLAAVSSVGKNFYARWFKMTNFHRRWAALPLLEDKGEEGCFPVVKAAQETQTLQALQQQIGQTVGNAGTAWQLLEKVLGYMLMEIITIPSPPAAITEKKTGIIKGRSAYIPKNLFTVPTNEIMSIPTFFVKPQCLFAIPPVCNVIFPSMISNFSFKESYLVQPTRVYLGETFLSGILNTSNNGSMSSIVNTALTTGYPEQVRARQKALLKSPQSNDKNFLIFPEEFYKGPISVRLNAPPWMYLLSQQDKANEASNFSSSVDSINAVLGEEYDPTILESSTGLSSLFDKFAEYEYYRLRYAASSGGVQLAWNPYIIPGFPSVVFDQDISALSVMGYVTSVTHTMQVSKSASAMSTSVTLTHIRPLTEALILNKTVSTDNYVIAPPEPIEEISSAFQIYNNVQDIYTRMLFSNRANTKKTYFDSNDLVSITTDKGGQIDPRIAVVDEINYLNTKATDPYKPLFNSYTRAMQYASRPVCTLKEYIETYHNRSLEDLIEDSTVRGEYRSFYSKTRDKFRSSGAVFWGRIYTLVQGPGNDPGVNVSNVGAPPEYSSAGDGNLTFVDVSTGMPQTRKNWDKKLEEYRKIIRNEQNKIAPLE